MDALNCTYQWKEESIGIPNRYIVANVNKVHMDNGNE